MKKRMLSLLLVLVMLLGLLPTAALAAPVGGGSGTAEDPYLIDGAGAGRFPRRGKRLGEKEHIHALREAHGEYRPGQRSLDANRKNDQYI